jgi:hypothetical protein
VTFSRMFRRFAVGVSGVLVASVLPGVGVATAYAAGAPTTRVTVTGDRHVQMPTQLRPGVRRLVVDSARMSDLQIIKPHAGYTKREFVRDVRTMFEDAEVMKRFEASADLVGGVSSTRNRNGVMWARLTTGKYWMLDVATQQIRKGRILTVRVGGESVGGVLPLRTRIRAVNEVDFGPAPRVIRQSGILTLRNDSAQNHFFSAAKLKRGKTMADFRAWVEDLMAGNERPAPVRWNVGFDSGVVGPDMAMAMQYRVPRGRYVLMCWWPDAEMDNMPHVFMGMYRSLRVR